MDLEKTVFFNSAICFLASLKCGAILNTRDLNLFVRMKPSSKDAGRKPYWTERAKDLSVRLWGTDEFERTIFHSNVKVMGVKEKCKLKWYNHTEAMISLKRDCPKLTWPSKHRELMNEAIQTDTTDKDMSLGGKRKKQSVLGSRKNQKVSEDLKRTILISIYPHSGQKQWLRQQLGGARFWYNYIVRDYYEQMKSGEPNWRRKCVDHSQARVRWHYKKTLQNSHGWKIWCTMWSTSQ